MRWCLVREGYLSTDLTKSHYIHNTSDLFNLKRDPLWSSREACDLPMQCNGASELLVGAKDVLSHKTPPTILTKSH